MTIEQLRTKLQIINEQFEVEKLKQGPILIDDKIVFDKKSKVTAICISFAGAKAIVLEIGNGVRKVHLRAMVVDVSFAADLGFALVLVERFLQEWGL